MLIGLAALRALARNFRLDNRNCPQVFGFGLDWLASFKEPPMPRYLFSLDNLLLPGAAEEFPDDAAAQRHACRVAVEINRNARGRSRVLVLDDDGELVAAVSPIDE